MDIRYAFLARGAELAPDGTMSVFGGDFGILPVEQLPADLPTLAILVKFGFQSEETPPSHIRVFLSMLDPDDEEIISPIEGGKDIEIDPATNTLLTSPGFIFMINLTRLKFPKFGTHQIKVVFQTPDKNELTADFPITVAEASRG